MLSAGSWRSNQANTILFVLVDTNGLEVEGIGIDFSLEISKAGGAFVPGVGTKGEIGSGWYFYTATAGEADTVGPVAVKANHASILQQNLEYVVEQRTLTAIEFTYTVTSSAGGLPIESVYVAIAIDIAGNIVVWSGHTDSFGVARDNEGNLPRLDPGTYYIFRQLAGWSFDNPDTEVVA